MNNFIKIYFKYYFIRNKYKSINLLKNMKDNLTFKINLWNSHVNFNYLKDLDADPFKELKDYSLTTLNPIFTFEEANSFIKPLETTPERETYRRALIIIRGLLFIFLLIWLSTFVYFLLKSWYFSILTFFLVIPFGLIFSYWEYVNFKPLYKITETTIEKSNDTVFRGRGFKFVISKLNFWQGTSNKIKIEIVNYII
jgi:hypothetical protein